VTLVLAMAGCGGQGQVAAPDVAPSAAPVRRPNIVFLLTDDRPNLLPSPIGLNGLNLAHFAAATPSLLDDLRSDRGMGWIPNRGWLSKIAIDASASQLKFDLAIDPTGTGRPSRVDAGLAMPAPPTAPVEPTRAGLALLIVAIGLLVVGGAMAWRRPFVAQR